MFLGDMGLLITWGFGAFEATGYQNLLKYL
jgi:hypothetical protein